MTLNNGFTANGILLLLLDFGSRSVVFSADFGIGTYLGKGWTLPHTHRCVIGGFVED
jgi:hypothetical protein